MRSYSSPFTVTRGVWNWRILGLAMCLMVVLPSFAVRGMFEGRVVEGNKREAGKYIYVAGKSGYLRRVNIQRCKVRFDSALPAKERTGSALDYLRDDAQVRITADQSDNGEWVAVDIVILKLPLVDRAGLRI
ncbi:MAG: hypothetical protein JOZ10_12755 [Acidobacteria bacterium]|nr:hypothetical protein [Acidobacteriota bacterium]MBV9148102.1 hypothetical protein [Acidobacteriota bacterium]MBV9435946.1 hypothetical protein [Acidobacteriota bacterium]